MSHPTQGELAVVVSDSHPDEEKVRLPERCETCLCSSNQPMEFSKIKALVLTHDANRPFAQSTVRAYDALWPDHPFTFFIPFQQDDRAWGSNLQFVRSPKGILETMAALLEVVADEEMVYWSVDDRIPINLNQSRLQQLMAQLEKSSRGPHPLMDGLCFTRAQAFTRKMEPGVRTIEGSHFVRRLTYKGIWHHQVIRGKVLKNFWSQIQIADTPRQMGAYARRAVMPSDFRLFSTWSSPLIQAEQFRNGIPTAVAINLAYSRGVLLPEGTKRGTYSRADIFGKNSALFWLRELLRLWRSN